MAYEINGNIKGATSFTKEITASFAKEFGIDVNSATNSEYELAKKGLVKALEDFDFVKKDKKILESIERWKFFKRDDVPETVHPSLWLNGKSNIEAGIFEVLPGKIFQARGLDIANITFVKSKTGWIVFDTGSTDLASATAVKMLEEVLDEDVKNKIRAIIVSHSHADHFGGLKGVVDEDRVGLIEEGKVPIYVPAGFDEETIRENVYAGTAMYHRANYQFGSSLIPGPSGTITCGLGTGILRGVPTYIRPTNHIAQDCTIEIDGLEVEFQLTPGTEAPAEMNNYIPEYKAFWAAENCTGTLHNLYPIRGAQVRDSLGWWKFTEIAAEKYGKDAQVVFQSHNWHHENTPENPNAVVEFLRNNAAIYKTLHDQTLRYANEGNTPAEIAKKIRIPDKLQNAWYIRPYYGSYEVNARAVFNKYLGFYNGNPVNLDPLTEREEATKFVEYAGGAEAILKRAKEDFVKGDYRWVAKATNNIVYAQPDNLEARYLCADAFEQLGYQSESSIWRNAYLVGAKELREGNPQKRNLLESEGRSDLINNMTTEMILDYIGISSDVRTLENKDIRFKLEIVSENGEEIEENYVVNIYAGTILYYKSKSDEDIPYVRLSQKALLLLLKEGYDAVRELVQTDKSDILELLDKAIIQLDNSSNFSLVGLK